MVKHFPGFYKCFEHQYGTNSWDNMITHIRTAKCSDKNVSIREDEHKICIEVVTHQNGDNHFHGFLTHDLIAKRGDALKIPKKNDGNTFWRCPI